MGETSTVREEHLRQMEVVIVESVATAFEIAPSRIAVRVTWEPDADARSGTFRFATEVDGKTPPDDINVAILGALKLIMGFMDALTGGHSTIASGTSEGSAP